jgi:hypothetical protein
MHWVGNSIKSNTFTAPLPGEELRGSIGLTVSRADPAFYCMHQLHTISQRPRCGPVRQRHPMDIPDQNHSIVQHYAGLVRRSKQ